MGGEVELGDICGRRGESGEVGKLERVRAGEDRQTGQRRWEIGVMVWKATERVKHGCCDVKRLKKNI